MPPRLLPRLCLALTKAAEPPRHHFAHHRKVIIGLRLADVELAVLAFFEAFRPGHHHRADGLCALNMAVVIDLNPLRRGIKFQKLGQLAVDLRLGAGLCQPPFERFDRVALRLRHQLAPVAAFGNGDAHFAVCDFGQSRLDQFAFGQIAIDKDVRRRRHFLVELQHHAGEHLRFFDISRVAREEGAVAPVLPAANEEGLHPDHPALGREREHIGIA